MPSAHSLETSAGRRTQNTAQMSATSCMEPKKGRIVNPPVSQRSFMHPSVAGAGRRVMAIVTTPVCFTLTLGGAVGSKHRAVRRRILLDLQHVAHRQFYHNYQRTTRDRRCNRQSSTCEKSESLDTQVETATFQMLISHTANASGIPTLQHIPQAP